MFVEIAEIFKAARWSFIVPVPICFIIGFKLDPVIAFSLFFLFVLYASHIGINNILIATSSRLIAARERLNDFYFNLFTTETDKLREIYLLIEIGRVHEAQEKLKDMVTENNESVNHIKKAQNGGTNE